MMTESQYFWMNYPFNFHISKWLLGLLFLFFVFRSYMPYWFPSSDVIVFIVSAFSFHWASSYSWEVENIRVWERENLRVLEWVSRGIFLLWQNFFPRKIFFSFFFFLVRTLMQRTQDYECVWKRDREEVHCYPFSLCTVELSMIHWWSFQCGAITELLPISTPPSSRPDCGSEACWETAGLFMWVAVPRGQLCEI